MIKNVLTDYVYNDYIYIRLNYSGCLNNYYSIIKKIIL